MVHLRKRQCDGHSATNKEKYRNSVGVEDGLTLPYIPRMQALEYPSISYH